MADKQVNQFETVSDLKTSDLIVIEKQQSDGSYKSYQIEIGQLSVLY